MANTIDTYENETEQNKPQDHAHNRESGSVEKGQAQGGPQGMQNQNPGNTGDAAGGGNEGRPVERSQGGRRGARGTAAMDPKTRQEVARKGGLAVSRNREHMAAIGRKGGQTVSKNREHMAAIGRKGGEASRGHH